MASNIHHQGGKFVMHTQTGNYMGRLTSPRRALLAVVTLTVLVGCTSTPTTANPPRRPLSSARSAPGPLRLGQSRHITVPDGYGWTVTVYSYRQPVRHGPYTGLPASHEYGGADVKLCATSIRTGEDSMGVTWQRWTLSFADDTTVDPVSAYSPNDFDVHLYPAEKFLQAGQCVRGWVIYELRKGERPVSVTYGPSDSAPVSWKVT